MVVNLVAIHRTSSRVHCLCCCLDFLGCQGCPTRHRQLEVSSPSGWSSDTQHLASWGGDKRQFVLSIHFVPGLAYPASEVLRKIAVEAWAVDSPCLGHDESYKSVGLESVLVEAGPALFTFWLRCYCLSKVSGLRRNPGSCEEGVQPLLCWVSYMVRDWV